MTGHENGVGAWVFETSHQCGVCAPFSSIVRHSGPSETHCVFKFASKSVSCIEERQLHGRRNRKQASTREARTCGEYMLGERLRLPKV